MRRAVVRARIDELSVRNLIANPNFGYPDDGSLPAAGTIGGYYIHVNNTGELLPDVDGRRSLRIVGTATSFDTHFSPEGRDGAFRVGLEPGKTYTASARVRLEKRLTGPLAKTRLSISPGWTIDGVNHWNPRPSASAENASGWQRIVHVFTVPKNATAAWLRYVSGMAVDGGAVDWSELLLVNGDIDRGYFDGDTSDTILHRYRWLDDSGLSQSIRELRSPQELFSGQHPLLDLAAPLDALARAEGHEESATVVNWAKRVRRGDPDLPYLLGLSALWRGDRARAVEQLTTASASPATHALAQLKLGTLAQSDGAWRTAEARYREAYAADARLIEAGYRLATALDKRGALQESRLQSAATAASDASLPFDIDRALAIDPKAVWARRVLAIFVRDHIDEIRGRAIDPVATASSMVGSRPVFTYWHQGFEQAPPLVQRCHESLLEHADNVQVITGANLRQYAGLPDRVVARIGENFTHLSDLIRLDVLTRFGGIWVDATCLFTGSIDSEPALVGQPLFCFNYSGPRVGTWFLAAEAGGYSISLLRAAMVLWWETEGYLADYFQLHYVLEMLYWFDERFREEWEESAHRHPREALALQGALHDGAGGGSLERIGSAYWVHKLTHKHGTARAGHESVAAGIVRGEARGVRFRASAQLARASTLVP